MRNFKGIFVSIMAAAAIVGCSLTPENIEVNGSFTYELNAYNVDERWWGSFNDERLNELVEAALTKNSDLLLALNALDQARINLRLANLELLPNITLQGDAARTKSSAEAFSSRGASARFNSFNLGAALSYEIDLWGRVRDTANASEAALWASSFDYQAARLSIAASVASSYFTLISLREQEQILIATLKTYEETLAYRQNELNAGSIDELIYHQSAAQVHSARTQLLAVQTQIAQTSAALNILIGSDNESIMRQRLATPAKLIAAPSVPQGISSDILMHRADIAAAKKRLESANFMIGVAKTNWLPRLSLTGLFGYSSSDLNSFLVSNANTWNVAGSVAMPLFDFGRVYNGVELAKLQKDATLINYDKVIKTAFSEIRVALDSRQNAALKEVSSRDLVASWQSIYDISKARFEGGYSTHLEFLDAQRGLLAAQLSLAQAKLDLFNSVVLVFKSLGGGFTMSDADPSTIPTSKETPKPANIAIKDIAAQD